MTVSLVISLPKVPYIHRIYMVLANPKYVRSWYGKVRSDCTYGEIRYGYSSMQKAGSCLICIEKFIIGSNTLQCRYFYCTCTCMKLRGTGAKKKHKNWADKAKAKFWTGNELRIPFLVQKGKIRSTALVRFEPYFSFDCIILFRTARYRTRTVYSIW